MKYLKMLGLAAVAAMGLMAFLGAGTASATTLCTTNDSPGCTMAYTAGTVLDSSLKGTAKLTGSGGEVLDTCTGGTVKGTTGVTSATSLSGIINSLTWTGCSTTTDTVANGELSIEYTSGNSGTVRGAGSQVTVNIFGVSCTYGTGTGTHLGTLTGGEAPILAISTTVTKTAGGFLCPGSAGWDAEYVLTEPHAVYVRP